jgi:hypothetical protein
MVANPPRSGVPLGPVDSVPPVAATDVASAAAEPVAPIWDDRMDDSWNLLIGLASALEPHEVREVAMPRPGTADRLIEALTPEEQAELIKLLQAEMGSDE